ncbi:DMT family transporter [Leifsonia poae]|uniref:DMT family transporter n=1 Tax=Leifsonia poae TaxID=110933 RepID=UPI001CBFF014|nr:DMT family transporter [Leifsonia poae]
MQREPAGVVAAGRSLFSYAGILLLALRSRGAAWRALLLVRRRPGALLVSGLLGVAVYAFASLEAISLVGVSIPNLLLTTTPLLTLVIGVLWFGKRGNRFATAGTIVATVGAALYVAVSFSASADLLGIQGAVGVGLALVAALSMAVYGQHYARISQGHDPTDLLPGIFGFGTVLLLILLGATGQLAELVHVDAVTWLLLLLLGVGIYVPVYVLQHKLIHARGAVYTATVSLAVPFVVRALEVCFLGGVWPSLPETGAMILCIAGVALVLRHPLGDRRSALSATAADGALGVDR